MSLDPARLFELASEIEIFFHAALPVKAAAHRGGVLAHPTATAEDVARGLWWWLRDVGRFRGVEAEMVALLLPVAEAALLRAA